MGKRNWVKPGSGRPEPTATSRSGLSPGGSEVVPSYPASLEPAPLGAEHALDPSDGPTFVFNVGPDGAILYVHHARPDVAVDLQNSSIFDHTPLGQQDFVRAALARVFGNGDTSEYEALGFPPFVDDHWYECRLAANKLEGKVVSATVVVRDITRWKDKEGELRRLCDRLKEEKEQLSASADKLRGNFAERDREREQARLRENRDKQELEQLSADVARLMATLAERDRELVTERARNVKDDVVTATTIAKHATRWKKAEDALEGERVRHKKQLEQLYVELAKRQDDRTAGNGKGEHDRFRRLLDQAGEAILITDPESGRFIDVNETACRWLRRSRKELLTLRTTDLELEFPVDAPDENADHVPNTRRRGRAHILRDGVVRRQDGSTFAVEVATVRRRHADCDYTIVVAREVNARKRTQQALREAEERFRWLFDLSNDVVYLSARDGTVEDANPAAVELFGYTREELLRLEARKLYKHAQDIRAFQQGVEDDGIVRDLPVVLSTKDGKLISGRLTATLRHAGDGSVLGYQCIIRPAPPTGPDQDAPSQDRNVGAEGDIQWVR